MKLEDQVASVEQCKKLKELGIAQKGCFSWLYSPLNSNYGISHHNEESLEILAMSNPKSIEWKERIERGIFSAFSVAELGLMLPDLLETDLYQYELVCIKEADDEWLCRYVRNNNTLDLHPKADFGTGETEAEARADLLISLLEDKLISVEKINKKLSC